MSEPATTTRRRALQRVEAIYAGEATWDDFLAEFQDSPDPPIAALVHLIEREPERQGVFAVPAWAYAAYRAELERGVLRLDRAANAECHERSAAPGLDRLRDL